MGPGPLHASVDRASGERGFTGLAAGARAARARRGRRRKSGTGLTNGMRHRGRGLRPTRGAVDISAAISGSASGSGKQAPQRATLGTRHSSQANPARPTARRTRPEAWPARDGRRGKGAVANRGNEGSEAGTQAAQMLRDQAGEQAGPPLAGDPRGNSAAQLLDEEGEAVGQAEVGDGVHGRR
jgi:hypothetical protein